MVKNLSDPILELAHIKGELKKAKQALASKNTALKKAKSESKKQSEHRQRVEASLDWESKLNIVLTELSKLLSGASRDLPHLAGVILDRAQKLTRSEHGYAGTIDLKTGNLISHTLTRMMSDCPVPSDNKKIEFPIGADRKYPGLWGYSLNTLKPFYTNSPERHTASTGTPMNHIKLRAFLSVPAIIGNKLVGQIALANPQGAYTSMDLEAVKKIADLYALAIQRHQAQGDLFKYQKQLEKMVAEKIIELENKQAQYINIFDSALDAILIINTKGRVIDANISACRLFGYTFDRMTGLSFRKLFDKSSFSVIAEQVALTAAGKEQTMHLEMGGRASDGAVVELGLNMNKLQYGSELHLLIIARDISESKKAERQAAFTSNLLELFSHQHSISDYLDAVTDQIRKWGPLSKVGVRLLNEEGYIPYQASSGFDKHFLKTECWVSVRQDKCHCTRVISGAPLTYEKKYFTSHGSFWYKDILEVFKAMPKNRKNNYRGTCVHKEYRSLAVIPIKYKGKNIGALHLADFKPDLLSPELISFLESVTMLIGEAVSRFKTEEAITESEERFRQLADNIPEVFWISDAAQSEIIYVSDAYQIIFGRSTKSLYKDFGSWLKAVHPEDRKLLTGSMSKAAYGNNIEYRIIQPYISVRWVRSRSFPVKDSKGNVYRIAGVVADITDYKTAAKNEQLHQQQLIQADKMTSLGILVSGIAHEINNPNNMIMLNCDVLEKAWKEIVPVLDEYYHHNQDFTLRGLEYAEIRGELEGMTRGISQGSERIRNIVHNLKAFIRQDTGRMDSLVDVKAVIESSIYIVGNLIKKSTDNFHMDCAQGLPGVRGNPQQLEQVIINLLTNACQALRGRDQGILVTAQHNDNTGNMEVRIKDEGCGIPRGNLKRVLEPFFTTKRDEGGTGLGLSVSYGIINAHNGSLEFESKPGMGTTAVITLPSVRDL